MKKIIGSIMLAAFLFGCGLAGATPILTSSYSIPVALGESPYRNRHKLDAGVTFLDTYTFTVSPAATQVSGSVVSQLMLSPFGSGNLLDITGLSVQIFHGGVAQAEPAHYFSGLLSPGEYSAQVAGTTTGSSGGRYRFDLGATAAPVVFANRVPEPQTLAMVGIGLGIMGLQLRRRNRKAIKLNLS